MSDTNPPFTLYDFAVQSLFIVTVSSFVWGICRFLVYDLGRSLSGELGSRRTVSTEIVQILTTPMFSLYVLYDLFSTHMHPPGLLALVIVMLFNVIVLYQQSFPHLVDHHSMLSIVPSLQ